MAVPACVSILLLIFAYSRADSAGLARALGAVHPPLALAAFVLLLPIVWLSGLRLKILSTGNISTGHGCCLILLASFLNLILPARAGDLVKAAFVPQKDKFRRIEAAGVVVAEKLLDTFAFFCVFGCAALASAGASQHAIVGFVFLASVAIFLCPRLLPAMWRRQPEQATQRRWNRFGAGLSMAVAHSPTSWAGVILLSGLVVTIQAVQIVVFALAINQSVPFAAGIAASVLALGMAALPISLGGFGSREAALVMLFGSWMSQAESTALAVLVTGRYLAAAFAGGIVFATRFVRGHNRQTAIIQGNDV